MVHHVLQKQCCVMSQENSTKEAAHYTKTALPIAFAHVIYLQKLIGHNLSSKKLSGQEFLQVFLGFLLQAFQSLSRP